MAFHESVWIVVGAAAPIIGLAAALSVSDVLREMTQSREAVFAELRQKGYTDDVATGLYAQLMRLARRVPVLVDIQIANMAAQSVLLGLSILCLATQMNLIWPWLAAVVEFLGLLTLGVVPYQSLRAASTVRDWGPVIGSAIARREAAMGQADRTGEPPLPD